MIVREIEPEIQKWLHKDKILILKGPRQVGKTTLLKKIQKDLEAQNHKCFYFSMDRYDELELAQDAFVFFEYLKDKGLKTDSTQKQFLFIDEFQYINEAGRFLKILFDEHKKYLQIIVTGSSSLEIRKNSEFLTGRKIEFDLQSLSFKEIFEHKEAIQTPSLNLNDTEKIQAFYQAHKSKLEFHFFDYLKFGGYPEAVLEEDTELKKEIIREITNTYLKKDIAGFLNVENVLAFNDLIQLLASQIGNLINKNEISNTLNLNKATLDRYLDILQSTYVFSLLQPYTSNVRKTLTKMPKIYISDFGLQKTTLNYFPQDSNLIKGEEVENFVFNLLKSNRKIHKLNFYRTSSGSEIDFIAEVDNGLDAYELKFSSGLNAKSKVPLAIRRFGGDLEAKNLRTLVITKDYLRLEPNKKEFWIPVTLLPWFV